MEFNILDFVQHILNIVVLYIILRVVLYNPVQAFMRRRGEALQQKQQQADAAMAEAATASEQAARRLEEAGQSARQLMDEQAACAQRMAAETLEDARKEAARIVEAAHAHIAAEQQRAQQAIVEQAADIAVELAERILGREINRADNQRLIDDFFRKVG